LFGAITSVGFCTCSMTFAIVKVLPEPVTPSSVWWRRFLRMPSVSSAIAFGWSPAGSNSDTTRNARPGPAVCGS
jgi:hypothetical protein